MKFVSSSLLLTFCEFRSCGNFFFFPGLLLVPAAVSSLITLGVICDDDIQLRQMIIFLSLQLR